MIHNSSINSAQHYSFTCNIVSDTGPTFAHSFQYIHVLASLVISAFRKSGDFFARCGVGTYFSVKEFPTFAGVGKSYCGVGNALLQWCGSLHFFREKGGNLSSSSCINKTSYVSIILTD